MEERQFIAIIEYFENMPDPRQQGKVLYPLSEMILTTDTDSFSMGGTATFGDWADKNGRKISIKTWRYSFKQLYRRLYPYLCQVVKQLIKGMAGLK
jgi:hypothetical protein